MDALKQRFSTLLETIIDRDHLDKKSDDHAHQLIGKGHRMLESLLNMSRNPTVEHILSLLRYDSTVRVRYIFYGDPPMFMAPHVHIYTDSAQVVSEELVPYDRQDVIDKFEKLINFIKKEL